jgi:CrcB protein
MWLSLVSISSGAAMGALLRWFLGNRLNALFPLIPPGTLVANMLGGYLIGFAVAFFAMMPNLAPEWRLFFITGFLGALTTFSTFSAEMVNLLQQGRFSWALAGIGVHVVGTITMTFAGMATLFLIRQLKGV